GLSDHSLGCAAACAAVGLGAQLFEKHFTENISDDGPDHASSVNPAGLASYVRTLRAVYKGLGDGLKRILPCERVQHHAYRRYLVAARDLQPGHRLKADDLWLRKCGAGLPPTTLDRLLGEPLLRLVPAGTPLTLEDVS